MNVDHLLAAADALANQGRRPRVTDLRRAVSAIYYGLFHALALHCANQLIGVTKHQTPAWRRVYRSLDHGKAKDEFMKGSTRILDPSVAIFADAFVVLQEARHTADYDPARFPFSRRHVVSLIAQARGAIAGLTALNPDLAAELATIVLFKNRR